MTVPIHESSVPDTCKGFTPRTLNRPRVSALKNTHLKSSRHRTDTTTVTRSTKCNRDECPTQWVRTIRSLDPVRGITHPSIPPPFHWIEKKWRETSFQESFIFSFSMFVCLCKHIYIYIFESSQFGVPTPLTVYRSMYTPPQSVRSFVSYILIWVFTYIY